MGLSVAIALCGIGLAYYLYRVRTEKPREIAEAVPGIYDAVYHKYYVDEIYDFLFVRRIVNGSVWLWQAFDTKFIDGAVNGIASLVRGTGDAVRRVQTGVVGNYAFSFLLGAIFIVGYIIIR
jgi:NADH-quinone oxidoreductase subunit L